MSVQLGGLAGRVRAGGYNEKPPAIGEDDEGQRSNGERYDAFKLQLFTAGTTAACRG